VGNRVEAEAGLKGKLRREVKEFVIVFLYLGLLIAAFNIYRWLVMAQYHVGHFIYGYSLVEVLILTKVVLIGESLGIGERFRRGPLIVPTLYKTLLFSLCVLVLAVLEHLIGGFFHHEPLKAIWREVLLSRYEILGRVFLMFGAFIPFFAFREAGRVLGQARLFELLFAFRAPAAADLPPSSPPSTSA
jgi:hypothetical protein